MGRASRQKRERREVRNSLTVWPASRIGPQLNGRRPGLGEPTLSRFKPPRMIPPLGKLRHVHKPYGGLWTSSLQPDGSSVFLDYIGLAMLERTRPSGAVESLWRLCPQPDARLLVVDSADDWERMVATVPQPGEPGPDYESITRAGFAGVHLSAAGAAACSTDPQHPTFGNWTYESTIWLRYAFEGRPARIDPAAIRRDLSIICDGETLVIEYTPAWFMRASADAGRHATGIGARSDDATMLPDILSQMILVWDTPTPLTADALSDVGFDVLAPIAEAITRDMARQLSTSLAVSQRLLTDDAAVAENARLGYDDIIRRCPERGHVYRFAPAAVADGSWKTCPRCPRAA